MAEIMGWFTFLGAWLLVIGPLYQAVIDIGDEEFDRDEFAQTLAGIPRPPKVSRWWSLLPPVAYALQVRRRQAVQKELVARLSPAQLEQVMHFRDTASAWMFVAAGAFLIAISETWDLREQHGWPVWAFWALLALMLLLSAGSTIARSARRARILGDR